MKRIDNITLPDPTINKSQLPDQPVVLHEKDQILRKGANSSSVMEIMIKSYQHSLAAIGTIWGKDLIQVNNEAFVQLFGIKNRGNAGCQAKECWGEKWQFAEQLILKALHDGTSSQLQNCLLPADSTGTNKQRPYTFSFSAIYNADNEIEGVLVLANESTPVASANQEAVNTGTKALKVHGTTPEQYDEKLQLNVIQPVDDITLTILENYEQLKKSEQLFHKMVEEIDDYAIILIDANGIIQNWNKGAETIHLYNESEIIGKSFENFYSLIDREKKLPSQLLKHAAENGKAIHEGWRIRRDQTKFWGSVSLTALHDENDNIVGYSKVTRDLTERKIAEDQLKLSAEELKQINISLRQSEERHQKMISEVRDYAIILLNNKGEISSWNAGAEAIKGYSSDEISGKHFRIFYSKDDREKNLPEKILNEATRHGKAIHEGWRVRKDGTWFWGSVVITALHADDGSIIGYSKVTRDLTERKLTEDKMQEYLVELESKNKDLEQFAYIASHDLQEPLRKIQVFIEIIGKNFEDKALMKKYFDKINLCTQRMSQLIKSVLNYSKVSADNDQMVMTDLNDILENVKADFELTIQEKKAVIESCSLPIIKAVPHLINQLFTNLIGNALKFTKSSPVIKISSVIKQKEQLENIATNLSNNRYLEIAFSDNGIGFEQQYEKLIFSMFQRLHGREEFKGTGIGLAVCKRIMEVHAGIIIATSEITRGSTFYVYFPV